MKSGATIYRVLGSVLLFLAADLSQAAPGDFDTTFAQGGKARFGFGFSGDHAKAVATQIGGKIVVAGYSNAGSRGVFALVRYNADGSLDTSFGTQGKVLTSVGPGVAEGEAVAVQADGKIIVAGHTRDNSKTDFAIVRYQPDGALDTGFGTGGRVITDLGSDFDSAYSVAVQANQRIVVGGLVLNSNGTSFDFALVRYDSNGSLDASFNGTGKVIASTGTGGFPGEPAVALQADGKIVIAGGGNGFVIARYNVDGTSDSSFNGVGKVTTPIGSFATCTAVAIQPAGEAITQPAKIVASGYSYDGSKEVFAVARYNLNGTLDTSFDGDGIVTTPIFNVQSAIARSYGLVFQAGSLSLKIVVAGVAYAQFSPAQFTVVRYNANGSLDTTLDNDGIATTSFGAGSALGAAVTLAGNRIAVVGEYSESTPTGADFATALFTTTGSLDSTFDGDGKRLDEPGSARSRAAGVAIQPDGKIVLGGFGGYNSLNFSVARLQTDGSLDSSFGQGGKVTATNLTDSGNALAIQSDGKIVLTGSRGPGTNQFDIAVARYNSNGIPDTSFDMDGVATAPVGANASAGLAVALQPDAKIVVAGFGVGSGSNRDVALVRLNPNGSLDSTFDFDGKILTSLGTGNDEAHAVAVQPDGKIVIAGFADNSPKQIVVARVNSNGSFDPSFDGDGAAFTSIGPGDAGANALALDSHGRVVVAGFASNGTNYDIVVVRYNPDGSLDSSFNGSGKTTTQVSAGDDVAKAVVIQPDGKIIVAGSIQPDASNGSVVALPIRGNFVVVRYNSNGSLDTTYGSGGIKIVDFETDGDDGAFGLALDGSGRAVVAGEAGQLFGVARLEGGPPPPGLLANISTRLRVETGDNALIGGFIITGTEPKKIIIRATGPSLGLADQLANPTLELYSGSTLLASNDDWQNSSPADKQAILDSTIPPTNDLEAALVRTLPANGADYTAVVRGVNGGTGIGVVEAYDLDRTVDSKLANVATRGLVQTGDNVLFAGVIVVGQASQKVIIRALGPSVPVPGNMADPTLELHDGNGALLEANDNWVDSPNKQAIIDSTIPPGNDLESAIVRTLSPANYTAVVRGVNDTTGIAVVEVYALD